jgi:predicted pyridoxine 5'-phosphate oxidase superfamily flavin-nucleotide-binding protein
MKGPAMSRAFTDIAFTPSVRAMQEKEGSAAAYAPFLLDDAERRDEIGLGEAEFIEARDGFYQATVSETGWPYVQFRGGPAGFLRVIDARTIAYADYRGNRQYLSVGNLKENDRVSLILMDYQHRRRLKIWGRVRLVDRREDPALLARLHVAGGRGKPERAVIITVEAFDWNCPQHIPQRLTTEELGPVLNDMKGEIERLRRENAELKSWMEGSGA